MLFSSIPFLYYFLPLVLAAYFVTPARFRNGVLLFSSLFLYAWGEPKYVLLMAVSILCGYGFGLLLERYRGGRAAKYICGISVGISLCFLLYFKYADFFLRMAGYMAGVEMPQLNLPLPIGISFYTFQTMSYVIASIPSRSSAILWTCIGENPHKKTWFISRPISRCFPS